MDSRLEAWWRDHRAAFAPYGSPPTQAIGSLADALRAELPDFLRAAFQLPADFAQLTALLGGRSWRTANQWHELWGADALVSNLALEVRVHHDRALIESAGPWIQFARSGDRRHFFLSCASATPHLGHVLEGDDDHPWLENGLLRGLGREPLDLTDAVPLVDWLEAWVATF